MHEAIYLPVIFAILVCPLEAKRAAPKPVPPVEHMGIRYSAPLDDGRRGYILAVDCQTNQTIWSQTIFKNRIEPTLEEDVQMVYIQTLTLKGGSLVISDERAGAYRLDLSTKRVTREADRKSWLPQR